MPLISAARATTLAVDIDPSHGLTRCSGSYRSKALDGALTLTNVYPAKLKLDPNGAARNVTLEAEASSEGMSRHIYNSADAAENLVILDDSPATVATLRAGEEGEFYCDGTVWNLIRVIPALSTIPGASTVADGTTVADAIALPAGTSSVYPVTAADDTKGVKLTVSDQITGRTIMIVNNVSNKILKVYGPSGAVINGASANAAFSGGSGKSILITCLSGSGNTWGAVG